MRRMNTDPGELIECSFESHGNVSTIYVPNIKLEDFPISFEILINDENAAIASCTATIFYDVLNGEVKGGGIYLTAEGNVASLTSLPDSLIAAEDYPVLMLELVHFRNDITYAPIKEGARVYIRNIVHLSKKMNILQ